MKAKLGVCFFADMPNFGDMLNVWLAERMFGLAIRPTTALRSDACFIGSMLDKFLYNHCTKRHLDYSFLPNRLKPVKVWGSGFIESEGRYAKNWRYGEERSVRRLEVFAARGSISLGRLDKMPNVSVVRRTIGDPGLLAGRLLTDLPAKRYSLGIVPHHIEIHGYHNVKADHSSGLIPEERRLRESVYAELLKLNPDAVLIDVESDPEVCVRRIAECERIASASLHGLIVADSLGVPNLRLVASNICGGNYKFDDYRSAFPECKPLGTLDVTNGAIGGIYDRIGGSCWVSTELVKAKQEELIAAFPAELLSYGRKI